MSRPLSARHALVLRYVACHPGATIRQVAAALSLTHRHAYDALLVLITHGLVGRQQPLRGYMGPQTWYAEPKGIEAAEAVVQ